jgi:ABA sandwich protein
MNMTRDEILNMPAGKEMDRLVVDIMEWEQIDKAIHYDVSMGIRWAWQSDGVWKFEPGLAHLWSPSNEIHDAWEVAEKIQRLENEANGIFGLELVSLNNGYAASFADAWGEDEKMPIDEPLDPWYQRPDVKGVAHADTAPLAICRAALLVMES